MVGASISEEGNNGSSSIPSQKRQRSSGDGEAKRVGTDGKRRSAATMLGLEILDCPICYEPLSSPIFQCDNGHLACSSCCPKLSNKCPACALPVARIRCRAMESVIESLFVRCRNAKLGCTKMFTYGKESTHEKECTFSLCSCPVQDCDYTGSIYSIKTHFSDHKDTIRLQNIFHCGLSQTFRMKISDKILIATGFSLGLLFPVQCFREPYGVYVTVSCIAPPAPEVKKFSYDISYTVDGHTVIYKSPEVKMILQVSHQTPQENFMLSPSSLLRGESLEVKICINELEASEIKYSFVGLD